ncbi:MAG: 23S rRNA (uracil(1939)-C(5))-methyltransferase RlmD [Paenibacillaceae bacterium]|nr:23S rRNA (uracil(1939)-C(5))-methyltransferase RlmD [Paenibacillaceae bacterium]
MNGQKRNGPAKGGTAKGVTAKSGTTPAAAPATAEDVRVGERVVVTVKRLGINGEGVGYYKRKAVFIPGALPDEVVHAAVMRVEPSFLHAELQHIEKRSPHRQEPECPVYEACGGCQLQHMAYAGQLQAKEALVREAFDRYARVADLTIRPIIGMEEPWGYRNKAQLQVGFEQGRVITGLYAAGSHKLVDIAGCRVQHPAINRAVAEVAAIVRELRIPVYDERNRTGCLRTVVARIALATGALQLTLITAAGELPQQDRIVAAIRKRVPQVAAIAHNVNAGKTPLVFGDTTRLLWGAERLDETLGDVRLSLSPRAFFQLNPAQTIPLYRAAQEAAALTGRELVVDAYCGSGAIGLWLAPYAREVRGIEAIPEAVRDAKRNAAHSGAANVTFYEGQAEKLLPEWIRTGVRPDVVVVDPPRTGCDRRLLDAIAAAKPQRLVYVSCNPSTLAKDCRVLLDAGFRIEWVQPVDMFPQTSHVESVILMVSKD